MRRRTPGGFLLIDLAIALALTTIALALVGSVFVATLHIQRRGQNLREAEAYAEVLVDLMARDVRGASRAPDVRRDPPFPVEGGRSVLVIALTPPQSPTVSPQWILYVHDADTGDIMRQVVLQEPDGRPVVQQSRVVARGVLRVDVEPVGTGVTVQVVVRRGRETAQARVVATPRNP